MNLLSDLTQYFKENEYQQICVMSGSNRDLGIYRVMDGINVLNDNAFIEYDHQMCKEYSGKNGNFLAGLLGAVLGASLGGVLWILFGLLNIIVAIVGFAIIMFATLGYTFLGGRIDKKGFYAITIISLLTIILSEYLSYAILIYRELIPDYYVSFWEVFLWTFEILKSEAEFLRSFLYNIVIGLVLTIVASSSFLYKTLRNSNLQYDSEKLI